MHVPSLSEERRRLARNREEVRREKILFGIQTEALRAIVLAYANKIPLEEAEAAVQRYLDAADEYALFMEL
jgi:hypothetical protein